MEDLIADVRIGGGPAEPRGQIHHGYVRRGHAEGHAGHLALQGRDHAANGLGCAGGGGDDVVEDGTTRAPVAAAAGVHGLLLGGGGMDGGHQGLLDAELLVDDIGQRRKAVGGAAGVGDDTHIAAVFIAVDAEHEGRRGVVLGRSRQDGVVGAGGLDDVLCAAVRPVDHRRVGLAVDLDLAPVDDQVAAGVLHSAGEITEYGVVLQQIHHVVHIRLAQVDTAYLEALRIVRQYAQHHPSDTAKAVDTDLNCHVSVLPSFPRPGRLYLFQVHYISL